MRLPYKNRSEAGHTLADALQPYANRPDVLILALPRGGVRSPAKSPGPCARR
jgi:putative phosphoribosyl transferase